jgi:hypothetical protein
MTDGNQPEPRDEAPDESGWEDAASSAPEPRVKTTSKSEPPKAQPFVKSEPPKAATTTEPPKAPPAAKSEPPKAAVDSQPPKAAAKSEPPKVTSLVPSPVIRVTGESDADEDYEADESESAAERAPSSRPPAERSEAADEERKTLAGLHDKPADEARDAEADQDEDEDEAEDEDEEEDEDDADEEAVPAERQPGARARERARAAARSTAEPVRKPAQSSTGSGMLWVGLIAAGLLGAWWLLHEPKKEEPTVDTTLAADQPAPQKAPEPVAAPPPPEPAAPAPAEAPQAAAPAGTAPAAAEPTPAAPADTAKAPEPTAQAAPSGGGSFDRVAALKAIAKNADKASRCRMRGEEAGTAQLLVKFEPSGRVQSARFLEGPYFGTHTGKCIIDRVSETTIAPFTGEAQSVTADVAVR